MRRGPQARSRHARQSLGRRAAGHRSSPYSAGLGEVQEGRSPSWRGNWGCPPSPYKNIDPNRLTTAVTATMPTVSFLKSA